MKIRENVSLRPFNTFGLDANARYFAEIHQLEDLREVLKKDLQPLLILGGGSNLLLTRDWPGLVIRNQLMGKKILEQNGPWSTIEAGAGESWHQLVEWAIDHNLGGIENLSLIPGTVGAAPIQNIGAYGVELQDVFSALEAFDLQSGNLQTFEKKDCAFGYRDSVFKQDLKNRFFITKVFLKLKNEQHELKTSYGDIRTQLDQNHIQKPTIRHISEAVMAIRRSKLPDPAKLGNAGSFFKNPTIAEEQFQQLRKEFPNIVAYPLPDQQVKIPAAWLIEQCGWKGKVVGHTGSHAQQALVLVNYGRATGREIHDLAVQIQQSVFQKFDILLTPEVNIL